MSPPPQNTPPPCWLAIRLPHLALNLLTRGLPGKAGRHDAPPLAVSDLVHRREQIIDADPAALAGGVKPGMPVNAALGILGELQVVKRDPTAEQRALRRLAAWCYQYSSQVCVPGKRAGLFIEAGASERLFGRPERLGKRLTVELGRLGYHVMAGSAPTREAAWLAAPQSLHIDGVEAVRRRLGSLSLDRLYLDASQRAAMENMGFRQLRDLLRLPRRDLTRRFGPSVSDYLDHLLGLRPDPRPLFQPPERFSSQLGLPAETHSRQALLFPARRLLEELCGILRGGDTAVHRLRITLSHEDHEDTRLELGLQSPTQDAARLLAVLRERLERLKLPQAVRGMRLEAPKLLKYRADQHSLFGDTTADQQQEMERLAERLQARLGRDAIAGLAGVQDHRPEYSWRTRALNEPPECTALAHRPAWLLPRPRPCAIGEYEILTGPERIESGWWDGRDCRRDYYVVRDARGSMLWVFHEYKPRRGWYLHGIFA